MRPNNQNDLDEFKRALTMAMRSISKEDELTVSFGAETGSVNGVKARLPLPNKSMSAKQLDSLRGEADSIALFIAHHKEDVSQKYLPGGQKASEIFNSLERTRCEAIGSNEMAGVAKNLNQMEKTKLICFKNLAILHSIMQSKQFWKIVLLHFNKCLNFFIIAFYSFSYFFHCHSLRIHGI